MDQESQTEFWQTLNTIQESLNLDAKSFAGLMEFDEKEFHSYRLANKEPVVTKVMALSKALNIGFDELYTNTFDVKTLVNQFYGSQTQMPEKYQRAALSKRRMSYAMLDFIEARFGWQKRALLLRRLQMHESMYENLDAPISGEIGYDILTFLVSQSQTPEIVSELGEYSLNTHRRTAMGRALSRARSASEGYELALNEIIPRYFNKYDCWKLIHSDHHSCEVITTPNHEALLDQGVNLSHFVNPTVCRLNLGYLRTFPAYAGFSSGRVKKTACVNEGHSACRYEISYNSHRTDHPHLMLL
jgi:hypothetical protein